MTASARVVDRSDIPGYGRFCVVCPFCARLIDLASEGFTACEHIRGIEGEGWPTGATFEGGDE